MISTLSKYLLIMHLLFPGQGSAQLSESQQKILSTHNEARDEVDVPQLKWSKELEQIAQEWADRLKRKNTFKHRPIKGRFGSKKGENIALVGKGKKAEHAAKLWLAEKKYYNEYSGKCRRKECGHYKQMVWKKTKKVGCGSVQKENGATIVVCNYDPPGNYRNKKAY